MKPSGYPAMELNRVCGVVIDGFDLSAPGGTIWTDAQINALAECSNNIVANPVFVESATNDFRLTMDSPCIDAGTPTTTIAFDQFGRRRLVGPAVDMGIFEMPPAGSVFYFW